MSSTRARRSRFPRTFWVLFWGQLFNNTGTSLVFPFLAVYLHLRLRAPVPVVGLILTGQGLLSAAGMLAGGVLADRLGRRPTMLVSLVSGAVLTFLLGLPLPAAATVITVLARGFVFPLFMPASQALVADLVPKEELFEAYSYLRIATNAGIILGPMLGAFLVQASFLWLFLPAAGTMLAFAVYLRLAVPRVPPPARAAPRRSYLPDLGRLRDPNLVAFLALAMAVSIVYAQLFWTVPQYLVESLHESAGFFGFLAAENGVFVVLLQVAQSRWAETRPVGKVLALGAWLYAVGFASMALWGTGPPFFASVFVITLGENLVNPGISTWVARRADPAERGQVIGLQGLASNLGSSLGPFLGGVALDAGGRVALFGGVGLLAAVAALLFPRVDRGAATHSDGLDVTSRCP
jgi:predicted MFS family arabinose efflux permease